MEQASPQMDDAVYQIMEDVISSYLQKHDDVSDEQWVMGTLTVYLSDKSEKEISAIARSLLADDGERMDKLWDDVTSSGKQGYNAQVWLSREVKRCMQENSNHDFHHWLLLQNSSMERLNKRFAQEIAGLVDSHAFQQHGKNNKGDEDADATVFRGAFVKRLHSIVVEEYEALVGMGVNPLLLKQQDLHLLALSFSKNAVDMGITTMIFMTELCLARKLEQLGVREKNRAKVAKAITSVKDVGIRKAVETVLKISSERGLLPLLAKGTPTAVFTGVAFVAIESSKVFLRYGNGEINGWQMFHQTSRIWATGIFSAVMEAKGCATGTGIGTWASGTSIGTWMAGTSIGMLFPGAGILVCGLVGGFICNSVGHRIVPYFYHQGERVLSDILHANRHAMENENCVISNFAKNKIHQGVLSGSRNLF